jgi:hypothetical protein
MVVKKYKSEKKKVRRQMKVWFEQKRDEEWMFKYVDHDFFCIAIPSPASDMGG